MSSCLAEMHLHLYTELLFFNFFFLFEQVEFIDSSLLIISWLQVIPMFIESNKCLVYVVSIILLSQIIRCACNVVTYFTISLSPNILVNGSCHKELESRIAAWFEGKWRFEWEFKRKEKYFAIKLETNFQFLFFYFFFSFFFFSFHFLSKHNVLCYWLNRYGIIAWSWQIFGHKKDLRRIILIISISAKKSLACLISEN